jgi:Icc-related predicted phosphoesterase
VVAISDLHNQQWKLNLPCGDILIVAGDMTQTGNYEEFESFTSFLSAQNKKFKMIIAVGGNHDITLDKDFYKREGHKHHNPPLDIDRSRAYFTENNDITYLEDSGANFNGINIFGHPWICPIGPWAFTYKNPYHEKKMVRKIPENTDILVTHGPAKGIRDVYPMKQFHKDPVTKEMVKTYDFVEMGSEPLAQKIRDIKPKLHVFGHIHYCYGWEERDGTLYVNASFMNRWSKPVNKPQKISLLLED